MRAPAPACVATIHTPTSPLLLSVWVPRCQTDLISPPSHIPESPGVGAVSVGCVAGVCVSVCACVGATVTTHQIQRDSYSNQCGRGHPPLFLTGHRLEI